MDEQQQPDVAVLMATYNGRAYVGEQIRSLMDNTTPFKLHWLDDLSTDGTRGMVRDAAKKARLELIEWHQPFRLGATLAFFRLLECVAADIYLFCDQDDIWQPGKIDATVFDLFPDSQTPTLCFSDPLVFVDGESGIRGRFTDVARVKLGDALEKSRLFMSVVALGHTQGFTRPLRESFLRHKEIARQYAFGHDGWMYNIAVASGVARILHDAPTTLYRRHAENVSGIFFRRNRRGIDMNLSNWSVLQMLRRVLSRHAEGVVLAAPTLESGPNVAQVVSIGRLMAGLAQRQSLKDIARLVAKRALYPNWRIALSMAILCLLTDA